MSYGLNVVIVEGRLVSAPELKKTPNDISVCTVRVAVQRDKDVADFFDCVAWRGTAEFLCNHFKKGDGITVEGKVKTRTYEAKVPGGTDTFKKTVYEIDVKDIGFPVSKAKSEGAASPIDQIQNALKDKNIDDFDGFSEFDGGDLPF